MMRTQNSISERNQMAIQYIDPLARHCTCTTLSLQSNSHQP